MPVRGYRFSHKMTKYLPVLVLAPVLAFASIAFGADNTVEPDALAHAEQVRVWRTNRDAGLRQENGWLSLVGLEWLQQGSNSLGSGEENSAHIPGGPARWGVIELNGDELIFIPEAGSGVLVDGQETGQAILRADNSESPSVISFGTISVTVIFRESYGLRISDSQAPARLNFTGIENYAVQPGWPVKKVQRAFGLFLPIEPAAGRLTGPVAFCTVKPCQKTVDWWWTSTRPITHLVLSMNIQPVRYRRWKTVWTWRSQLAKKLFTLKRIEGTLIYPGFP
jgi:hypothetical protein